MQEVFKIDPNLRVRSELLGIHAVNPFCIHTSSSRSVMFSGHFAQAVTLDNGDEKIIQTGLEKQLGAATFSVSLPADALILDIIRKYSGIDSTTADEEVGYLVIFKNLETNELDCVELPPYHKLDPKFGFKYHKSDAFYNIMKNTILPKDTVLADSPAVVENSGYKFGVNANMALMSLPVVDEDAVVVSKSLAKKMEHKLYMTRVVEFGEDKFPLNIYGDENTYKAFPDIGEHINDTGILMGLREYDSSLSPALTSKHDVRGYDPLFDDCTYVSGPGGKIVDIKAYKFNPRKDTYTGTVDGIMRYVNGLKKYHNDILISYNNIRREHREIPVSPKLHKIIVEAHAQIDGERDKLKYAYRKDRINMYRVEFVIEYTRGLNIGSKITGMYGNKGIVSEIRDDEDMPVCEETGIRADIIMDPLSVNSRMNNGRLYDSYIAGTARNVQKCIKEYVLEKGVPVGDLDDSEINYLWDCVLEVLSVFETPQYKVYSKATIKDKVEILNEIIDKEFFIHYKVDDKASYLIVDGLSKTRFAPKKEHVLFRSTSSGKVFKTKSKMLIAPEYIMLLNKTAENFLSTASSKVNHHGLPISDSSRNKVLLPYKNTPVKTLSETDARVYGAYVGRLGLIELKDRANSLTTHKEIYANVLKADNPANMPISIDRSKFSYGDDAALNIVENVLSVGGAELEFVKDKHKIHKLP